MATKIAGKQAKLVDQGASLNAEIKALQEELKEVRASLKEYDMQVGSYATRNGSVLKIIESGTFADVSPKEAHAEMKKLRLGKHFPEVVKINITSLKRFLSEDIVKKLRPKTGVSQRWSWS